MIQQDNTPYFLNQIMLGIRTQLLIPGVVKVHLFQNDFNPTDQSLLTDFTEATYDGYAATSISFPTGPFRRPDGSFAVAGGAGGTMTGSTTPNTIFGYYLTDFTGTQLIASRRFATPIPMVDEFSHFGWFLELAIPRNGILTGDDPGI
jgi:hypothetical protein